MHIITWKAKHVIMCLHSVWTTAKIVTTNFNLFYFNQACGVFVTIVSGEILSHPACSKVNINTADSCVFVNNSTIYVMQGLSMLTLWSLQIKRHGYKVCLCNRTPTRWCDQLSRYSSYFFFKAVNTIYVLVFII